MSNKLQLTQWAREFVSADKDSMRNTQEEQGGLKGVMKI